ncbi:hypothetical protein MPNT_210055 [Candidatus Methylacidithermus pantelleriae]|uniref:Uncharacterized protein n=1 Tax=Candidatus Methylacidithermus pantelleriae TaxID=2744239 RepID=A0A8J2BNU7_9BACT|nr:hypothetical protein MPNT_210055 [Candidatus Methylacidithermus pantelleriae]
MQDLQGRKKTWRHIREEAPVPDLHSDQASMRFDKRTYTTKGESVWLYTIEGRMSVPLRLAG